MQRRTFLHYLGSLSVTACGSTASTQLLNDSAENLANPDEEAPNDTASLPWDQECLRAQIETAAADILFEEQDDAVFGEARGLGLNGRLYTALSRLSPETLLTDNSQFYIRTRYPNTLNETGNGAVDQWVIAVNGAVRQERSIAMSDLLSQSVDQGVHLMECSGNFRAGGFGLMSSARFDGVKLSELLPDSEMLPEAQFLEVVGHDDHAGADPNGRSIPGASWILTREQFQQTAAFLATHMNGEPLPLDHGFPVRLLNPGWYGCSCIKWVTQFRWLPESAATTSQMREFAGRTHQDGTPLLAKDYAAPSIQVAAMPIRVEQWQDEDGIFYHVVGVIWGGGPTDSSQLTANLELSFDGGQTYTSIECGSSENARTWRLWSVQWQPTRSGEHDLVCRIADPNVPARRLDSQYYRRRVTIPASELSSAP